MPRCHTVAYQLNLHYAKVHSHVTVHYTTPCYIILCLKRTSHTHENSYIRQFHSTFYVTLSCMVIYLNVGLCFSVL